MLDLGGSFKIIRFKPLIVLVRKATQSGETGAGLALRDRVVVGVVVGGSAGLISYDWSVQWPGDKEEKRGATHSSGSHSRIITEV